MAIEVYGKTIKGKRKKQEDDLFYQVKGDSGMAVACDGIGGLDDGDWASYIAVQLMKKHYNNHVGLEDISGFFYDEIQYLDQVISNLEDDKNKKIVTGTTFVSTIISNGLLYWASVGDSKIFLLTQNKKLKCLTREHNYRLQLDEALKQGIINEDEYNKEIKKADSLISYLGIGNMQLFDISAKPYQMNNEDMAILCTDGIFRALSNQEILNCIENNYKVEDMVNSIINCINNKNLRSQDNATIIIMKYWR